MTELLAFAAAHYFVFFLSLVCILPTGLLVCLGVLAVLEVAIKVGFRVVNRMLRTINIATRGWPPPHLDADGDAIEQAPLQLEGEE